MFSAVNESNVVHKINNLVMNGPHDHDPRSEASSFSIFHMKVYITFLNI